MLLVIAHVYNELVALQKCFFGIVVAEVERVGVALQAAHCSGLLF